MISRGIVNLAFSHPFHRYPGGGRRVGFAAASNTARTNRRRTGTTAAACVAQGVAHFSPKTIFYPPQRADATQIFQ